MYPLINAQKLAEVLEARLQPACHKIQIAGSIRRKAQFVHDIDLIAWPIMDTDEQLDLFGESRVITARPGRLLALIEQTPGATKLEYKKNNPKIIRFLYDGVPVEIYLTEARGQNFGALLQMRTGPATYNEVLAMLAKFKGRQYRAGYGIFDREDHRLDDDSERRIIELCGAKYVEPTRRT